MIYIGIDNGSTGTLGMAASLPDGSLTYDIVETPTKLMLNYQKVTKHISRVDTDKLTDLLKQWKPDKVVLERPMINPLRFQATLSAARALEATLIVLEQLKLPYMFVDSKQWQKAMLPAVALKEKTADEDGPKHKAKVGSKVLKKLSMEVGERLFPKLQHVIHSHGDADGLLIAEWARKAQL